MIVRVRRLSGYAGGSNYYHHADIVCKNKKEAIKACKEGRVANWRWIDTFDTSRTDYLKYDILYEVTETQSKSPMIPMEKKNEN